MPLFGALTGTKYTATLQPPLPEKTWVYSVDRPEGTVTYRAIDSDFTTRLPLRAVPGHRRRGARRAGGPQRPRARGLRRQHGHARRRAPERRSTSASTSPGALFSIGDGHYTMGEGEVCGVAVEGAMDVLLTVDVIKGRYCEWPRIEDDEAIMVAGSYRPLEDAFRIAHTQLITWIAAETGLSMMDTYQLVTQASRSPIANVCDANYTIVATMPKRFLPEVPWMGGDAREAARDRSERHGDAGLGSTVRTRSDRRDDARLPRPPTCVATVAGRPIPLAWVEERLAELLRGRLGRHLPPGESGETQRLRRWIVQELVTRMVLLHEAEQAGLWSWPDSGLDQASPGMDAPDVPDDVVGRLFDRVTGHVVVPEAEIDAYLERDADAASAARGTSRSATSSPTMRGDARAWHDALREAGSPRGRSADVRAGGMWLHRGELVGPLEDAVFAADVDAVVGPFAARAGLDRRAARGRHARVRARRRTSSGHGSRRSSCAVPGHAPSTPGSTHAAPRSRASRWSTSTPATPSMASCSTGIDDEDPASRSPRPCSSAPRTNRARSSRSRCAARPGG